MLLQKIQYLFLQDSFDLSCATEMQNLNYKSLYKDTKTQRKTLQPYIKRYLITCSNSLVAMKTI